MAADAERTRELMKRAGWGTEMSSGECYGGSSDYRPSKIDLVLDEACYEAGAYAPFANDESGRLVETVIDKVRETIKHATRYLRPSRIEKEYAASIKRADETVKALPDLGFVDAAPIVALAKTVRDYYEAEREFRNRDEVFEGAFGKALADSPYLATRQRFFKEVDDERAAKTAAAAAAKARREADEKAAFDARVAAAVAVAVAAATIEQQQQQEGAAKKRPRS